jgi:hypothetical protein
VSTGIRGPRGRQQPCELVRRHLAETHGAQRQALAHLVLEEREEITIRIGESGTECGENVV